MGLAYEQKGMATEAIAEREKGDALSKHGSVNTRLHSHAYAIAGQQSKALEILSKLGSLKAETNFELPGRAHPLRAR